MHNVDYEKRTNVGNFHPALVKAPIGLNLNSMGDADLFGAEPKISARNVNFYYGTKRALNDITLDFSPRRVTIGL